MSSTKELRAERNSGTIERLSGAALFLASAVWVLWQNSRVAVLWDLSYLLDSSWRFSLGERPYRDVPFAHAPLTFLIQAALIRVLGRVYWPHLAYAALAGGASTVLAWRLLIWALRPLGGRPWGLAAVLALPLVPLGIYGVYPHPIYDSDCILACLLSLILLTTVSEDLGERERRAHGSVRCVLAGASCAIPIFVKQNIGIPFFGAVVLGILVVAIARMRARRNARQELQVIGGALAGLGFGVSVLQATVGLSNYIRWTVQFAARRRLPGLPLIAAAYRQELLVWGLPCAIAGVVLLSAERLRARRWASVAAIMLIAAPFVWTLVALAIHTDAEDRADQLLALWPFLLVLALIGSVFQLRRGLNLRTLMPWILLATIHGAFLSQQLWGSTYACWPLLMVLVAGLIVLVRRVRWAAAVVISCTLVICGGVYAGSLERLSYIHLDGGTHGSSLPALRGMRTAGPWLPGLDELVRFTDAEIPRDAGVLLIPGEDPFFFATGRVPVFPALLFDPATYPYSPEETVRVARSSRVEWVILKHETQLTAAPYEALPAITAALLQDFTLYRTVGLYDVYRRRV